MSTRAILDRTNEVLRPLGFFQKKMTWTRTSGHFVDVIHLQTSKAGDTITINTGVLHQELYAKCWGTDPPAVIDEALCIVRARVGDLLGGKDFWWTLTDDRAASGIAEQLTTLVLPFLERMHSYEAMKQFLERPQTVKQRYPLPIIYLAILKNELGDKAAACILLGELGARALGAWKSRTVEVARRLGC